MDFSDQVVLVYLEEDNMQRAFFRIRPLLRRQGPLSAQQIAEYPDDGYLRIVPDKNEQHTFKERMRSLGTLCVLNLKNIPPEANKIRTNKNYSPARGETNQFIVYSDAVQAIPEKEFFEVVAEGSAQSAVTPQVYARVGGNIHGPVDRATGNDLPEAQQLPPDSPGIFAVTLPSGTEKLFYWPAVGQKEKPQDSDQPEQQTTQEAETSSPQPAVAAQPIAETRPSIDARPSASAQPAAETRLPDEMPPIADAPSFVLPQDAPEEKPKETAQAEPLTALEQIQQLDEKLNASVNRLDAPSTTFAPPVEAPRKLVGTPLYQTPVRRAYPQRSHNPLMETVENQRLNARYEAPGAQVTGAAEFKDVVNPVESFKRALAAVWRAPETQQQTVNACLSMPGLRELIAKTITVGGSDLTLAAMHAQLQDMEAERLMTLMQLERMKKDAQAARESAAKELTAAQQAQLEQLRQEKQRTQEALEQLNAEREKLLDDRDKVLDTMEEMADADDVIRLAPQKGETADVKQTISRVSACLAAQGFEAKQEDAVALLINYALADGGLMGISAPTNTDALDAARAFAHALGAASAVYQPDMDVHVYAGGDAPAFLIYPMPDCRLEEDAAYTGILLNIESEWEDQPGTDNSIYPCGFTALRAGAELPVPMPCCPAVQAAKLKGDLLACAAEPPAEAKKLLESLRAAFAAAGNPLSIRRYAMLYRFVSIAQTLMNGGIAAALDEGVLSYVVPQLRVTETDPAILRDMITSMPRTMRALAANA